MAAFHLPNTLVPVQITETTYPKRDPTKKIGQPMSRQIRIITLFPTALRPCFGIVCFVCVWLLGVFAFAQTPEPLPDTTQARRKTLRALSRALSLGKRLLKKNPCRAQTAFSYLLAQAALFEELHAPNPISAWKKRNKRPFLRSIRKMAAPAKRLARRVAAPCKLQQQLEDHQKQIRTLQRIPSTKNTCEAYNQLAEADQTLSQGPGFSARSLSSLWRRNYNRWYKAQKRSITRQKNKALRQCRSRWRKHYKRGRFQRACQRRWKPRNSRQRGQLWIGVDAPAMLFLNDEACGTASIQTPLRTGRYLLRLTSPEGNFPEQSFTIFVKRGAPTLVLFHPQRNGIAVARRLPSPKPPTRREDGLLLPPDDPPPTRRTTDPDARTSPPTRRIATRDDPPDDPPPPRTTPPTENNHTLEAPLWIGLGARFFSRNLYYNDDIFGELSPYNLLMAPSLALQMHWYPGAHFTQGPLAHIGLVAEFSYALGLQSRTPNGKNLPTDAYQLQAGLRGRLPLGPVSLMLTVGYALQSFRIDTKNPANESGLEIPSVDYHALRIEPRAYWAIHPRVGLFLGAAYRVILAAGEIATEPFFPRLWIGQIDAEAGLDIHILRWLAVRTRFQFNHAFSTMNSQPGDRRVAGGAIDQSTNIDLFLVFRL